MALTKITGFPKSSNEYDKWIKMGRVWKNGSWWEAEAKTEEPEKVEDSTKDIDYTKHADETTAKYHDRIAREREEEDKDVDTDDDTPETKDIEKAETRYGYGILGERFEITSKAAEYEKWLENKNYTKEYISPTTLDEYYQRFNKDIPDFDAKGEIYSELGLGDVNDYYGTAEQDEALLGGLLQKAQTNYTSAGGTGNIANIRPEENEYSKLLTGDTKQIYYQFMRMLSTGSAEEQKAWKEALDLAGEQSGVYFKEQLNIFKDEFSRALGTLEADLEAREKELSLRNTRLGEDIESARGDLSVEETAELSRRKREYDNTLKTTRDTLASKGLSSSSIRTQAEEKMSVAQTDIIESTERRYARSLRDAELVFSRGLEDTGILGTELTRKAEEGRTAYTRGLERTWGTEELKGLGSLGGLNLSDYLLGDVEGTIGADQITDIMERANLTLFAGGF